MAHLNLIAALLLCLVTVSGQGYRFRGLGGIHSKVPFYRFHHGATSKIDHNYNHLICVTSSKLLTIRGGDIKSITSLAEVESIIEDASNLDQLVVLDFASNNCPPCEMIAPIYKDMSELEEFSNVIFLKVNVSYHPEVAEKYDVDGWPTFLLFRDGAKIDEIVGGQAAKAGLYSLVAKHA